MTDDIPTMRVPGVMQGMVADLANMAAQLAAAQRCAYEFGDKHGEYAMTLRQLIARLQRVLDAVDTLEVYRLREELRAAITDAVPPPVQPVERAPDAENESL